MDTDTMFMNMEEILSVSRKLLMMLEGQSTLMPHEQMLGMCRVLGTVALCKSGVWCSGPSPEYIPLFTLYIPLCNLTPPGRCFSHLSKEIHESYTPYLQVILPQLQNKTKHVITVTPLRLCCSTIPCAPPTKSPSRTIPMLQLY